MNPTGYVWIVTKVERFKAWCLRVPMHLLRAVETLTVLGLFFVGLWLAGWLIFGADASPRYQRARLLIELIDQNWRACLLLGVPLFYRPIRAFVERVQKAWGVEAPAHPQSLPASHTNPPLPPGTEP